MASCLGPHSSKTHWFLFLKGITRIIAGLTITSLVLVKLYSEVDSNNLDSLLAIIGGIVTMLILSPLWLQLHALVLKWIKGPGRSIASIMIPSFFTVASVLIIPAIFTSLGFLVQKIGAFFNL